MLSTHFLQIVNIDKFELYSTEVALLHMPSSHFLGAAQGTIQDRHAVMPRGETLSCIIRYYGQFEVFDLEMTLTFDL